MNTYPLRLMINAITINKNSNFVLLSILLLYSLQSLSQSYSNKLASANNRGITPQVQFISDTPNIDGHLDSNLEFLNKNSFEYVWQFDNPVTDTVEVTYRLAYTPTHLYVYLETDIDSITYHRRGYLWGDGYKVLLGIPQMDSLTNEYYELFFSPTVEKEYEYARQGISYYNFDQVTNKLSSNTQSQESAHKNTCGFEALIAWEDVKPYHPWFMNEMGYNIYFAKGFEHEQHGWITNGYSLVKDEGIWMRRYLRETIN